MCVNLVLTIVIENKITVTIFKKKIYLSAKDMRKNSPYEQPCCFYYILTYPKQMTY